MAGSVNKDDLEKVYSEQYVARASLGPANLMVGNKYIWNDGSIDEWSGAQWIRKYTGGAASVSDVPLNYKIYSGSGYTYHCQSVGGSALTDAAWQVLRVTDSDGTFTYAGTEATFGAFSFRADDLATVAALTYNNGVAI